LFVILLAAGSATAQPAILKGVSIDQRLGQDVPLDAVFRDESGNDVTLGSCFAGRPMLLTLVYFKCPGLCTTVLNDLTRSLNGLTESAGQQFDIITVSFDPNETPDLAAAKKRQYLKQYRRESARAGWHFLTGSEESTRRLTEAVGFHYTWDPKYQVWAHASAVMVLTPKGKLSRYFYGIDYPADDLRLAMNQAAGNNVAAPAEKVLLYCFRYDPATGRYGLIISRALKVGGVLCMLVLGGFIALSLRRERRAGGPGGGTHGGLEQP
jgi:protein SCO1/2